jgi:hypothetical protein
MRLSIKAKLGLRVAEVLALTSVVAACSGGQGSAGATQGFAGDAGVLGASDDGGDASTGCPSCDLADDGGGQIVLDAAQAEAGTVFDGDPKAVFVATSGSDSAAGSMSQPVASISRGVLLAQQAHKDLYVCDGTYTESVVIANAAVNVHGGYDCANGWARVDDVAIVAPNSGVPLTVKGVSGAMTVERLQLQASDAVENGASSIASIVVSSSALTFNAVTFQAGAGAHGQQGVSPAPESGPATSGGIGGWNIEDDCKAGLTTGYCGSFAHGGAGPAAVQCSTGAFQSPGGNGGNGGNANIGLIAQPGVGGSPAGLGGSAGLGIPGTSGQPGVLGKPGAAPVVQVGTFSSAGYSPTNAGGAGTPGSGGAGGGGGSGGYSSDDNLGDSIPCGYTYLGGGGGGGGYGGCGGGAGGGGGGGGASVGLLAYESVVTLSGCQIDTSPGGDGGAAGKGANGQPGGAAGPGGNGTLGGGPAGFCGNGSEGNAKNGGAGGHGGAGGPGGPGGGGPSIGIVLVGSAQPDTSTIDFNIGTAGNGGTGLVGPNGPAGLSSSLLSVGAVADAGGD